mmetsp:Transcript_34599/g.34235  ORF Transcript_34599/g.34235 Transcript_34599/m.34235 type:complete len:84 (-) Transcript_34599:25-276(-)
MLSSLIILAILMFVFPSRILHIIYCTAATLIFSFILIADTQMLKGDKEERFGEDDYILAALMIYIDIITIFLQLVQLLAQASD